MDLSVILEKGGPFVAAVISASVAGWAVTRKQNDESMSAERKYLKEELGKTRERVAVLEDHIRKLESSKNQAIARLRRENEALRTANTRLISELSQCQLKN
jgi:cell division protein FtsB